MAAGRYRSLLKSAKLQSGSAAAERLDRADGVGISTLGVFQQNLPGSAIEGDGQWANNSKT
jgi:hypothetical protein